MSNDLPDIPVKLNGQLFMDMKGGGYSNLYVDELLGISKTSSAKTRTGPHKVIYRLTGDDREFTTVKELMVAYYAKYPERKVVGASGQSRHLDRHEL